MVSGMRCGHFIKSLHLIQKCSLLVTALLKAEPEMKHWCLAGHWWGCSKKLERGRKEYQMGKRSTTGGIWLQSLLWAKGLYSAATTPVLLEDKMLCAMHACSQRSQLLDFPGLGCPFSWPSSVPRTWDRMQSSETHTLKVRCGLRHTPPGVESRGHPEARDTGHRRPLQLLLPRNHHYVSPLCLNKVHTLSRLATQPPGKVGVTCLHFIKEGREDSCAHA